VEVYLAALREVGQEIDTELIELAGRKIGPCIACSICRQGLSRMYVTAAPRTTESRECRNHE